MKKQLCYLLFTLLFFSYQTHAQEAVLSSGASHSGSAGSQTYSVGQVAFSEYSSSSGTVSEGVQQTYDISTFLENKFDAITVDVFPNPTSDHLTIDLKGNAGELFIDLLDIKGNSILNKSINPGLSELEMSSLPPATYFLELKSEDQKIKTFKIIKN